MTNDIITSVNDTVNYTASATAPTGHLALDAQEEILQDWRSYETGRFVNGIFLIDDTARDVVPW